MTGTRVRTILLDGFDDPRVGRRRWSDLLRRGDTDGVNLTWEWQRSWWRSFGRGQMLLIAAECEDQIVALAPLFADGGMVFNICPEDMLDFVGDVSDPDVLDAMLLTAIDSVDGFQGFQCYFVPNSSGTGERLAAAAGRLGLACCEMARLPSPYLDLAGRPDAARACTEKQSLVRHERSLGRVGRVEVHHMTRAEQILPNLECFFEQHVNRRAGTAQPSIFTNAIQRDYYRRLTEEIAPTGWLRFSRLDVDDRPVAFHYGLCYHGRYLYGIPSFDIGYSRYGPGEVLLRQLLLAAIAEGAQRFDFGIGDEQYKYRFATDVMQLHTWGLYPDRSPLRRAQP